MRFLWQIPRMVMPWSHTDETTVTVQWTAEPGLEVWIQDFPQHLHQNQSVFRVQISQVLQNRFCSNYVVLAKIRGPYILEAPRFASASTKGRAPCTKSPMLKTKKGQALALCVSLRKDLKTLAWSFEHTHKRNLRVTSFRDRSSGGSHYTLRCPPCFGHLKTVVPAQFESVFCSLIPLVLVL